jgi:glycosyltransferase involved in cell wall biosynthesis
MRPVSLCATVQYNLFADCDLSTSPTGAQPIRGRSQAWYPRRELRNAVAGRSFQPTGQMRICLIGGIFGKSAQYRAAVQQTPETVLELGLRARGHSVSTLSHFDAIDVFAYDVIHVHHLSFGALMAATAEPRPPLVFTSHAFCRMPWARRAAYSYVLSNSDASVVLSDAHEAWERSYFPLARATRYVIPNGVDEKVFAHRQAVPPKPGAPWRVLYVGQLIELKRVDLLLQALALLEPDVHVALDLVYHVDTEEENLRRAAQRLDLNSVRFMGARAPDELAVLYANAHLLVLPSTAEALPTVIAEALLIGRPVVATDVGGVKEQVGDFGKVIPPGDPQTIASAITEVVRGYDRLVPQSQRVSQDAAQRYSVRAMLDAHEDVYETCVNAPAAGATGPRLLGRRSLHRAVDLGRRLRRSR